MAAKQIWTSFYWEDYERDTGELTTVEHGAYFLLIKQYYRSGKPLSDNDTRLAMICKLSPAEWRDIRPVMAAFFQIADGVWRHRRIEHELAEANKRIIHGQKAITARWSKKKDSASNTGELPDTANRVIPEYQTSISQSQSHDMIDRCTPAGAVREDFEIPTLNQVRQFASEQVPPITEHHAGVFFNYNQDNGWRIDGEQIRHWRKALTKFLRGIPASLDEVRAHCRGIGKPDDVAEVFWNYFESTGWVLRGNMLVTDWKSEVQKWPRER